MHTIDITTHLGAVSREVKDVERDGQAARAVVITRTYDTDVEDLWNALTDRERIPRWFLPVEGDLEVGGRYQTIGNAGGVVLACEPPTRFEITWEMGEAMSWVEVTLAPAGAGRTALRLEHTALPNDHWDQYGPGAVGIGWELALIGLGIHLRTAAAVDPEAFMAWQLSPDAAEVMRASGTAWGDADAAGGTDPATARAAADRTVAAYTTPPDPS